MNPIILPVFPRGFHVGPLFIHYYALAYIIGLLAGANIEDARQVIILLTL